MNQKIPFYGMSFSHGTIKSKKKIKANIRKMSDGKYIPIHSFGTLGTGTYFSTTIVCFNILANVYGTEFLEIVSRSLLSFGDNYMKRYKVTSESPKVEKAVAYLFLVNLSEIQTYPQNRFYTFYAQNQQPYDYTLLTNVNNETVFSNIPFPTVQLTKEGRQKYYTITDFLEGPAMSTEEFEERLFNIKNADGSNMFTNKSFIGSEEVDMRENSDPHIYMDWLTYVYKFGICNIINIFSILTMGLYGSNIKFRKDDHFECLTLLNDECLFSEVIQYFANYNPVEFECKGIFTFHCKAPDFNIISEHTIFSTQEHHKEGLLSLKSNQVSQQRKREQYSKMKRRAQKLVTRYIGK